MFLHALLVRPNLSPFVTLKLMKLTLTHGLSFLAPLAFGTYGMLCIHLSDRDAAVRFGQLSVELLERFQVREYIGRVYAAYYACIFPWKYPMRDGLDHLLYAHRSCLQTGDVEFSSLCANLWSYLAIDAGIPLNEIEQQWTNFQVTMKTHRQETIFRMSVPCLQTIQYFQGKDVDFSETEALLQHSLQHNLRSSINGICWTRAKAAFLFNDYEKAHELTHDANVTRRIWSIPPSPEIVHVVFLNGMIMFALVAHRKPHFSARKRRQAGRQYVREGMKMIRLLRKYALWIPANFLDKKYLLDAELAAVNGRSDEAMQYYISAIALAKENRSLFVQGVANERAGRYCFTVLQQPQEAVAHFRQALLVYEEWTAHRKVGQLQEALKEMYGPDEYNCLFLDALKNS
jgi:histidine kinase